MQSYCEKLVWNATKNLGAHSTLLLARKFMKDYDLNKHIPPSTMIEYLLSAPDNPTNLEEESDKNSTNSSFVNTRHDLNQTETAVRECLAFLPTLNRNVVIRRCLVNLEKDERCAKDYERHSMVLQLYHECLDKLSSVMKKNSTRAKAHEEETSRVGRRLDALVVISSIFDKYPNEKKPEYTKMFEPLPRDPSQPGASVRKTNVIGIDVDERDSFFDPLAPLESVLLDDSTVAALAPLCSLLLLPSGYLHARSLVVRFRKLKSFGSALPSFDTAVMPVVKKLRTARDKADLLWHISLQYDTGSVEQLKCLDMAHTNATIASEEAESSKDAEEERLALERVKRVDASRAGLSDRILVDEILKRHASTSKTVKKLYKTIIDKVHRRAQLEANYCPEHLVQALLIEGSLTAAVASLDDADEFATHHFRLLALMVHDACKSLSNRYSHVNVGKCARLLTRKWLVHGDEQSEEGFTAAELNNDDENIRCTDVVGEDPTKSEPNSNGNEQEDTSDFVMDMGMMSTGTWSVNNNYTSGMDKGGIASANEFSALSPSSLRESSDHHCGRVALRIAFLICFAEDYHSHSKSSPGKGNANEDDNASVNRQGTMRQKRKLVKKSCFEGDLALQHSRELLGIVFARQGSTIASTYHFLFDDSSAYDLSILSTLPEDTTKDEYGGKSKALSFAMRHRALRVATILCPQTVIARVVVEEMYSSDVDEDHMNKFAFASFIAMEIEAMGLPLPHSDLVQLSAIHFPSFARTIWRNHGNSSSSIGFSGRLHLLLLELVVYHHDNIDWELFMLIFSELERLELPRSLLLACECALQSRAIALAASQERNDVLQIIESATKKVAELVVHEVKANIDAAVDVDVQGCVSTLHRLTSMINAEDIHKDPTYIVEAFSSLSSQCREGGQQAVGDAFDRVVARIVVHLTDHEIYNKALTATEHNETDEIMKVASDKSVCSEAIAQYEQRCNTK